MTVIPFSPKARHATGAWDPDELEQLVEVSDSYAAEGAASDWSVGTTAVGDPPFYVLGLAPDYDCIFSVSRLGRLYVLENGSARVLREDVSLQAVSEAALAALRTGKKLSLAGRALLALGAVRLSIEEKVEPLIIESEEIVLRMGPQFAAFI